MPLLNAVLGGASLLGGLLGQSSSGLSEEFFNIQNNQTAYDRSRQFSNPNSSIYRDASRGFYNRLSSSMPSASGILQTLASQGINSPTVANLQRQAGERRAGEQAANYESDLFGNFQQLGLGYLQEYFANQKYAKSAYANQAAGDDPFESLANFGGGLLGYELGNMGRINNMQYPNTRPSVNLYPNTRPRGL